MVTLVSLSGLGVEMPDGVTPGPTVLPAPTAHQLTVKLMSRWEILVVGVITGFGLAAGGLAFNKVAKRLHWR